MKILVYIFVVAFLGDHVLCQQVDENRSLLASQLTAIQTLCKPHDNTPASSTSCARCESQPGKRGPKGEVGPKGSRGDVGETGSAGIVDQTLLDTQQNRITELDTKVEQLEADKDELNTKVEKLEADNGALNTKVEKLEADNGALKKEVEGIAKITAVINCKPHNGVVHGRGCFFALDGKYTFEAAQTACEDVHGNLAYIDTPEVYDTVKPYLRRKVVAAGSSTVHFWIGATMEPSSSNRRITFLDGRTITWSHDWDSSYPSSTSGYTAMLWEVWATEQSSEQGGFWNHTPTYSQRPLCQKAI